MVDCLQPLSKVSSGCLELSSVLLLPMCQSGLPLFFCLFFFNRILYLWLDHSVLVCTYPGPHCGLLDHGSRVLFALFEPSFVLLKTTIRSNCTLGPPKRLLGYLSDKPFGPGNNFPELFLKHPSAVVRELP